MKNHIFHHTKKWTSFDGLEADFYLEVKLCLEETSKLMKVAKIYWLRQKTQDREALGSNRH
jgi:hypothetical protein